jgi:hypothetical protein
VVHVVALVDVVALVVAVVEELVEGLGLVVALALERAQVLQDNLSYYCICESNQCCTSPRSHDSCHMILHHPTCSNNMLARPMLLTGASTRGQSAPCQARST